MSWAITPLCRFANYLWTSPKLERNRLQAITNTGMLFGGLFIALGLLPFPNYFHAPGVIQAKEFSQISNESPGFIEEIFVRSGSYVNKGQPLFRLKNEMLTFDLRSAEAKFKEVKALYLSSLKNEAENLAPVERQLEVLKDQINHYQTQLELLTVRAPHRGSWVAPQLDEYQGMWSDRGNPIGYVINSDSFYFSSIVSQNDASRLFSESIPDARVRLVGESEHKIPVHEQRVIQAEQSQLPSAALGFYGGGDVAVSNEDATQSSEPFFEVRSYITNIAEIKEVHGRTGRIRFKLPSEPLFLQWLRSLRQLLQDRYQI